MSKNSDTKLINLIKNTSCSNSLKELVSKHNGLIYSVGKKYSSSCGLDLNEIDDNKYWIVYSSCLSYKSDKKTKFSTWLASQVRFFCLNFRKKNSKFIKTENDILELLAHQKDLGQHNENKQETIDLITDIFNSISDINTKNAIYYRYFYNKDRILKYSEIAEILNVTPQTVLNWHNKFIQIAKKKLTNE